VITFLPDVKGYIVRKDARKCSFKELLEDAFDQFTKKLMNLVIISKVPRGMMEVQDGRGDKPWILPKPSNITEAYDTFLIMPNSEEHDSFDDNAKFRVIDRCKGMETIDFGKSNFENLLHLWKSTGNFEYQISSLPLNGPCVGASRNFRSVADLLHREFGHAFTKPVVSQRSELTAHGVVNLTVPDHIFSGELQLFLACFICGTTLETGRQILEWAEFRLFPSPFGKLIGLIKKGVLSTLDNKDLVLVTSGWSLSQGLQIAVVMGKTRYQIVGKTQVPKGIGDSSLVTPSMMEGLIVERT
jgi:hypothetical protein